MKRDDLKALGLSDEHIETIMKMHGTVVEANKTKLTELQGQVDNTAAQLTEANAQIEKFKGMKPEEIQKAADDYKLQLEQAQAEHAAQLSELKFGHALDGALATAKAKNPKAVKALLDMDALKKAYDENTGVIVNFEEHLKPIKTENDYLFADAKEIKVITSTNNKSLNADAFETGLLKGAKLAEPEGK